MGVTRRLDSGAAAGMCLYGSEGPTTHPQWSLGSTRTRRAVTIAAMNQCAGDMEALVPTDCWL
jgi:hypothetical protein